MCATPDYTSFQRYLAAKKTVDDRALNAHVWQSLASVTHSARGWQVLEAGCGIGTMVERVAERALLTDAHYLALDLNPENLVTARTRLNGLSHQLAERGLAVEFVPGCALQFAAQPEHHGQFDLLIAHAMLDLWDVPSALPRLLRMLRPGGHFFFTINFDGATLFQPELDPPFEALIEAFYHRTMDERVVEGRPSGDSRTGRRLFRHLQQPGIELLAAGSSDWVVFAQHGRYPADEAYFLHFIIQTLCGALHGHPELDAGRFERWIAARHAQIERGELVYIAHQLDFFGRLISP
jgi:SAM-dependent methyltransferase